MKIELKLTADQVFAVAKLMQQVYEFKPTETQQKLMRSIAIDVADKYTNKQVAIYSKQSLFDVKKLYKISLKFHEAYALCSVLKLFIHSVNDVYSNTILNKIIAILDQKLA
jgi:hypothetical protein